MSLSMNKRAGSEATHQSNQETMRNDIERLSQKTSVTIDPETGCGIP